MLPARRPASDPDRHDARTRAGVLVAVLAVLAASVVIPARPARAQALDSITLAKEAPAEVLVGEDLTSTLVATNPSDDPQDQQYNVTFRDVLPAGIDYVGTDAPSGLGDPRIIAETDAGGQPTGRTILIWDNVGDLPDGADLALTYTTAPRPDAAPVGAVVDNEASVHVSSDPRTLPPFDADGEPLDDPAVSTAADTASTSIEAITVDKSEPSPENELLRGVHERTTVHTLTVTNNPVNPTDTVTVVDHLPAGLEFLGCGAVDNTPGTDVEYPGAPRLDAGPDVPQDCLAPTSVTTTDDPPAGYPAGVYTRVEWTLPAQLAPGEEFPISYAVGIPLQENVLPVDPATFASTANLDNNTGPSTRETDTEISLTNRVVVTGAYQGSDVDGDVGTIVTDDTDLTVTAEDVAVTKSVDDDGFEQGGLTSYELQVRVGEYTDASDLVVVDTLPDGLCPADAPAAVYTAAAAAVATDACAPLNGGGPPNPAISEVDVVDGEFVVTFASLAISADQAEQTISHLVRNRTVYGGGGSPTSAGDSFTNTVDLEATTTPIEPTDETGDQQVADESSATIGTNEPALDKRVLPATPAPHDCDEPDWDAWQDDQAATDDDAFTLGSRVCFQVRVAFPDVVATRNPVVTDFLPAGLAYEEGSFELVDGVNTAELVVDDDAVDTDFADNVAAFRPGTDVGADRYVSSGQVLAFRLSAIVTEVPTDTVDVQGNLAKLRFSDSEGNVSALRDKADFVVAPPPPLTIDKLVQEVTPDPSDFNDDEPVRHDTQVRYEIALSNAGTDAERTGVDVLGPEIWDVLPAGFACDDMVDGSVSDAAVATCTDPGDPGHPTFQDAEQRSAITWDLPDTDVLAPLEDDPGNVRTVGYDLVVPGSASVGTSYVNTASVRSYATPTNRDGVVVAHFPSDNVDTTVDPADQTAPPASDDAAVTLPPVVLDKTNVTSQQDEGNGAGDAVPGETVTYTVRATVPAGTTVHDGQLVDPLPADLELLGATAAWSPTGADPATEPLPSGVTFDAATGTLSLGATWTNDSDDDQVFAVILTTRVAPDLGDTGTRTNTATFTSDTTAGGDVAVPPVTATSDVEVVQPRPDVVKSSVPALDPVPGETITYRVDAGNGGNSPTLYDPVITDVVPEGLVVDPSSLNSIGTWDPATRTITWILPDLPESSSVTLTYEASIDPDAAGAASYTNTAELVGSTLGDGTNDPADERVLTATDSKTLTVPGAQVTKSVADDTPIVGERVSYTITTTLPAGVNFHDATVVDTLPTGLDPATLATTSVTCTFDDDTSCTLPGGGAGLTPDGQTVGWLLGDLDADARERTVAIAFDVVLDPDDASNTAGTTRSNTATVRWDLVDGDDPTSVDEPADETVTSPPVPVVVQEPQVEVDKTVDDADPAPGDTFTYTIGIGNPGGANVSPAHDVVVVDTVPDGVVVDPATISDGGTWEPTTRTITWAIDGPLAPGDAPVERSYDATLAASATLDTSDLVNTADVTAFTSLPDGGRTYDGPSDDAAVTPAFPHASIVKDVAGPGIAYVGEPQAYTITVTSDGDSPARAVDVADVLPAGWTYDTGSATVTVAGGPAEAVEPTVTGDPQTLTWTNLAENGLAVGAEIVVAYTATPGPDAIDDVGSGSDVDHVNTVSVTAEDATGASGNADEQYGGPDDDAAARIHEADLVVVKTADGTPVAGEAFSWTIQVSNDGPDPAVGPIEVTDTLPGQLTGAAASGDGWSCSPAVATVTCTHPGPVAAGATMTPITVSGTVPSDLPADTDLVNTAEVTGRTHDPDPTDDEDTSTTAVTVEADLALDKSLSGDVVAGEPATWVLDVTNLGPSTSAGPFTITDTLPAGVSFVSAGGDGWTCQDPAGGELVCTHADDLPMGAVAGQLTVTVDVPADRVDDVTNAAVVDGNDDPVEDNDDDTVTTTPTRTTTLDLEKALAGDDPMTAGDVATYEFTVRNTGPSTATDVTLTDTLPDHLSYEGATTGTGWTCDAEGQDVTCTFDAALAVDATTSFTFDVRLASDHTGEVVNVATATAEEDPDGDSDDDTNQPELASDLQVVKSHDGAVVAGTSVTYDIEVTNAGPSDSAGPLTVTDPVPDGLTHVSSSGADFDCDADDGTITCTLPDGLAADDSAIVELTFDVAPDAGPATLTNRVAVDGPNDDPDLGNNTDEDPAEVVDEANVSVAKTASAATVDAGATTTWTIDVTNDGPSTADDVTVTDLAPSGLTVLSLTGEGWTCDDQAGTCSRPSLAPGDAPAITVETVVGSGVADGVTLTNAATVATATGGDDPDDNESQDTIDVTTSADLALDKVHDGDPVAGEDVTFALTGTNNGPSDARGPITITDMLPAGLTYVSSNDAWTCLATPGPTGGQQVDCTLVSGGPVLAGEDAPVLELTAHLAPDQAGETLTNTASVASATDDPDPSNDDADDQLSPVGEADLSVTKTHPGPVEIGQPLTFTVQVVNDGPSEARQVQLDDLLPDGLVLEEIEGQDWTCEDTTCVLDDPLAPGEGAPPVQVTVMVTPAAHPAVTNTAEVSSGTPDPDDTNNVADDRVDVPARVDLTVDKQADGPLAVGEQADYVLEVGNLGPTADPGPITLRDELPDGLEYVDAAGDGWTCSVDQSTVDCERAAGLGVDATSQVTLTVLVGAAAHPEVVNTATVDSPARDVDPANDTSTVSSPVAGRADLTVDKTVAVDGTSAVWQVVATNHGPTVTTAPVVVTDDLPDGLEYVSAEGEGWACDHADGVVTCSHAGSLEVDGSASVAIHTDVVVTDGREITNVATVSGGNVGDDTVVDTDDATIVAPEFPGDSADPDGGEDDDGSSPGDGTGWRLPRTGSSVWWLLVGGLLLVVLGGGVVRSSRRRA